MFDMKGKQKAWLSDKRKLWLQNALIILIVGGIFGFFVWSTVQGLSAKQTTTYYMDNQSLSEYMNGFVQMEVAE